MQRSITKRVSRTVCSVAYFVLAATLAKNATPQAAAALCVRPMSTLYKDHRFSTYMRKRFDFLKHDYGFEYHSKALGYTKNDLELEFYYGRGEVQIIFFVNRIDEIFKPYVSRSFDLLSVIKQPKNDQVIYPKNISWPLLEMKDVDLHLEYCANLARVHGKEILMGNMDIFEKEHLKRRENA